MSSNDHYIPEFLTAPWKAKGNPLWHFSFKKKQFLEKPSLEKLFARRNLWSPELEAFLNKQTENFSAKARERITNLTEEPNVKEFQSLYLLILFQAARTGFMHGLGTDLENIKSYSDEKLGQLVQAAQQKWYLCGIRLPEEYRFFFPDIGIFVWPILSDGKYKWVFALPMEGRFCLALVPNEISADEISRQIDFSHLVAWSVGSSKYCGRIVIHPDLYHYKNDTQTLASEILRMRDAVDEQIKAINNVNDINARIESIIASIS